MGQIIWRAVGLGLAWIVAAACHAGATAPEFDGRNLYLGYCASCHGAEGKGDGPVAAVLTLSVPDLRALEPRDGAFPRSWLREVIDGRSMPPAHGSRGMPVWGWQFQLEDGSEPHAQARIDALVEYLRTIQIDPGE